MSRYLIVAHDTATNPTLIQRVQEIAARGPGASFVLLVPATPVTRLLFARARRDEASAAAQARTDEARAAFADAGVELAATRVGAASPLDAVADELRDHPGYDGIIVSTLPLERSSWLQMGLPAELERRHGLPVTHVELEPDQLEFWLRRSGWGRGV
jgi:GABA permease